MRSRATHVCSATAFERFPDAALAGSLVDRFAEQVSRHRECTAVVDGATSLTYGELDVWSNGIAAAIVAGGDRGRRPVALVVRQGTEYSAAVLGTLKAGRAYVPIDPSDPAPRIRDTVAACGATVVVTDAHNRSRVVGALDGVALVHVDETEPSEARPGVDVGPEDVAYVFFTSGTTGAPKGVYDSHRNVLHNVLRYTNALEIAPSDRLSLLQGPAFSGCVSSQFGALLNGATTYPFRLAEEGLVRAAGWLDEEQITIYHSVPSIFRAVVSHGGDFRRIRVVRLEGDRSTSDDVELWQRHCAPDSILANGLGTTETGLARQLLLRRADTSPRGVLPVGYPVRDMTILLVDDDRVPVKDGDVGEIAVASDYLALGYWNRRDLTERAFELRGGTRIYFTGDLGRLTADGCLEYLGRRDGSLKVLGARVEPAEIEREIMRLDGVRDVAVTVWEGRRGEGRLHAYVVPDRPGRFDLASVRCALAEQLPSAMLPTALVELDVLPLGPNGKVDRTALPEPRPPTVGHESGEIADDGWLAAVWADVLGIGAVGPDDDFFALGGDSLAAAEIVARIEIETGRALPPATLVRAPTVTQLKSALEHAVESEGSAPVVLRAGNDQPPLVLLHGHTGTALQYGPLVARMDDPRPIWALELLDPNADLRVEAIASRHASTLSRALPDEPLRLVGFCYAGVIAHELGRQLAAQGRVVHVALLGISPLDFPTVVTPAVYARWRRTGGPTLVARARYHAHQARRIPRGDVPAFAARRARNLGSRVRTLLRTDRDVPTSSSMTRAARRALESHRPASIPGRPLVVLHRADAELYTDDPAVTWAALGTDGVDVALLPGWGDDMLGKAGVAELAGVLRSWAESVTSDPL